MYMQMGGPATNLDEALVARAGTGGWPQMMDQLRVEAKLVSDCMGFLDFVGWVLLAFHVPSDSGGGVCVRV